MSKKSKQDKGQVSIVKLLAWQTRPIALGSITIVIGYLSLFCTDILQMPALLVGTILMASKICDGITDLIAGWIVDNTHTKWGKGRPYEWCLVSAWICTYALFSAKAEWSITVKSIWLFIMYTLVFSVFSTLLNAAETPYIIRAFKDRIAVTKVAAYGGILITAGSMVVSISFPMFVGSMGTTAAGWQKLITMYAIPLVLVGMLRFLIVKEERTDEDELRERVKIRDIFKVLRSNKYIWFFAIACMIPQTIHGMGAASYFFSAVVGDIRKYSAVQAFGMVAMLIMIIFPTLMKRFSAMQIIGGCSTIALIGYLMQFVAGTNMTLIIIGFVMAGLASLPTSYMKSPVIMQIADYNESNKRQRMEATIASAINFLCKLGAALGSFLFGALLTLGGYDGKVAVQTADAKLMIRFGTAIVPAILMIVVIMVCRAFRPLDKWSNENEKEKKQNIEQ